MSRGVKNNQIVNSSYLLDSILQIFIPVTLEIATKKADRIWKTQFKQVSFWSEYSIFENSLPLKAD